MIRLALILLLGLPAVAQAQQNPSFSSATLRALDKVTARATTLELKPDLPTTFGNIDIFIKTCWIAPSDQRPEHAALMEIIERKPGTAETEVVFSGWMFKSSPALSALEHPVYDVTLIKCHR